MCASQKKMAYKNILTFFPRNILLSFQKFTSDMASKPNSISPLETKPCSHVLHDSPSAAFIKFTPLYRYMVLFLHDRRGGFGRSSGALMVNILNFKV